MRLFMEMHRKAASAFLLVFLLLLSGCPRTDQGPSLAPSFTPVSPKDAQELYQQAEESYKSGKIPNAISLWERISQKYPSTAVAAASLNRVGEAYLARGQYDLAAKYFDFLFYNYPLWDEITSAKLNQLKLLAQTGKTKQVMREAMPLWEQTANHKDVRFGLAELMVGIYGSSNDIESAFEWSSYGFSAVETPEQKKSLTGQTKEVLKSADEGTIKKLYKKNPPDFMKVFLDLRQADIMTAKNQRDQAVEMLKVDLAQNPSHPLAPEIRAALRGSKVAETLIPLNPDRIGVMVPLNGANAKYGDMVIRGVNLALSDWRETHPNDKITLVIKDAGLESGAAAQSYDELASKDGVLAIVGPLGIQANKEVAPHANRDGVPLLSLTSKDEDDTDSSFVLHVVLDSRDLVRTLVRYCREKLKYNRFACLYPDDRYGQKLSKIFAETVQEQGGTMMASASYMEKSTDFTGPLQKLTNIAKKNAPDSVIEGTPFEAIFIPDQVSTVSIIAPQLPYNNVVGVTLLGTNLWSEAPLAQSGGVYVDQALFATSFFPENQSPRVKAFSEKFMAAYNSTPSYLAAQAYDALMMLLEARKMSRGSVDRNSVFQNLLDEKRFPGVAGTYTFNQRGELERQYTVLQVVNGSLNEVSPLMK